MAYLHKPLFWKWNQYREQLEYPYGNFFAPWVLFFIPCAVLAFARVYYKTAGVSDGHNNNNTGNNITAVTGTSLADPPSSKRRITWFLRRKREQRPCRQVAILPAFGVAAAYDGGAVGGSLERPAKYRRSFSGDAADAEGSPSPGAGGGPLASGAFFVLSALVSAFGLVWFRGMRMLAREVVDVSWHPVISVAVYNAWLCCALVIGLYVLDFFYYTLLTRGRTLLRDGVAVAVFVTCVNMLHSSNCGGDLVWAAAIGVGVVALGVGHGSRQAAVNHLSGRVHFRCVTASCALGTAISLVICYNGATAHRVASRHAHAVAATVQMLFTALVYASVVSGVRLPQRDANAEDADSNMVRSCSTASFVGEALMAPGSIASSEGRGAAGVTSASEVRLGRSLSATALKVAGRGAIWVGDALWRRRRVTGCVLILMVWTIFTTSIPTTPTRRFERNGLSCLKNQAGYVDAGEKHLAGVCGPDQALRPVSTGAHFEAFRQDKMCLEVAGGGFLTIGRTNVAETCAPETQFVFHQIQSLKAKAQAKAGSPDALSSAPSAGSADSGIYCVYNPTSGLYLSAQNHARVHCGPMEHWHVEKAPRSDGQVKLRSSSGGTTASSSKIKHASMLLHPNYLSHGPLHTVYGYLLVATTLLLARAVFAKLLEMQTATDSGRGSGGGGNDGGGRGGGVGSVYKQRRGNTMTRHRARGRKHTRCTNSAYVSDNGYFGDPGYAGDAETGTSGHGDGSGNISSGGSSSSVRRSQNSFGSSDDLRTLSESPVGRGQRELLGWSTSEFAFVDRKESRLGGKGDYQLGLAAKGLELASSKEKEVRFSCTGAGRVARGGDRWFVGLLRGLCLACDATLLAGLWCLAPAHFSQALSALTHDHHTAIRQGLGGDSSASNGNLGSRHLVEGGDGSKTLHPLGLGEAGASVEGDESCNREAWLILATLIRWHLLFLLVAFCHLHLAVAAASAAGRGRNRRTGRKIIERASFWGLRAGERMSMRLRSALGVLTLMCAAATAFGADLHARGGAIFLGLHSHPSWGKCAASVGLDASWGIVSPLLLFALLAASSGVYVRAGASNTIRLAAISFLAVAGLVIWMSAGRTYLLLAVGAVGMDWAAWGIAGMLSCICYKSSDVPYIHRESSGSAASVEDPGVVASGGERQQQKRRGGRVVLAPADVRQRNSNDARRSFRDSSRSAAEAHRDEGGASGVGEGGAELVLC